MKIPLQITFRDIPPSNAIEDEIRRRARRLDRFFDRTMSCRVAVEGPHHRHRKGNLYRVRIDITVPGQELVVGRNPADHHAHEDLYVVIRDAFRAARRELQEFVRRRRDEAIQAATAAEEAAEVELLTPATPSRPRYPGGPPLENEAASSSPAPRSPGPRQRRPRPA